MMRRPLLDGRFAVMLALLLCAAAVPGARTAGAISCAWDTIHTEALYHRADAVFTGTVIHSEARSIARPAPDYARLDQEVVALFAVDGVLEGAVSDPQEIRLGRRSSDPNTVIVGQPDPLPVGARFLVPAFRTPSGLEGGGYCQPARRLAPLPPPLPAPGAPCRFVLGFAALRDALPDAVGDCLENERHDATTGDAAQRTTGGLLVWRKADNATAFTDGHRTWVVGPFGLQERLNDERFDWEALDRPPPLRLLVEGEHHAAVRGIWRWKFAGHDFWTAARPAVESLLASGAPPVAVPAGARIGFVFDGPAADDITLHLWRAGQPPRWHPVPRGSRPERTMPDLPDHWPDHWMVPYAPGAIRGETLVAPTTPGVYVYEAHARWRHFHDGEAFHAFRIEVR